MLASVLQPLADRARSEEERERKEFNEHGYLWWRSLLVSLCRGAPRRRPRPSRLSSTAASRDFSQRPSRALVRHFGVVAEVAQNELRVFACETASK